jgi:hypothetical protein
MLENLELVSVSKVIQHRNLVFSAPASHFVSASKFSKLPGDWRFGQLVPVGLLSLDGLVRLEGRGMYMGIERSDKDRAG